MESRIPVEMSCVSSVSAEGSSPGGTPAGLNSRTRGDGNAAREPHVTRARGAQLGGRDGGPGADLAFAPRVERLRDLDIPIEELKEGVLERIGDTVTPQPILAVATGTATVVVKAPSDAKIEVNGHNLTRKGEEQSFATPTLTATGKHTYEFVATLTLVPETVTKTSTSHLI